MSDNDNVLIAVGDKVKRVGDYKLGGYLLRFTNELDRDLEGEYFSSDTYLGEAEKLPVYYHHGYDEVLGKEPIGTCELKRDDVGVWVDIQLTRRDEYADAIMRLAEMGVLGLSSGAVAHLVERRNGKITQWPLGEASITPTPAEPRNEIMPMKSYLDMVRKNAPVIVVNVESKASEVTVMSESKAVNDAPATDERELAGVLDEAHEEVKELQEKAKARGDEPLSEEEINARIDARVKRYLERVLPSGQLVQAPKAQPQLKRGDIGRAIKEAARGKHEIAAKVLQESTDAAGGYLVPEVWWAEVVEDLRQSSFLRRAGAQVMEVTEAKQTHVNRITDAAAATVIGEGGAFASNEPSFSQVTFNPYKIGNSMQYTFEMMEDVAYLEQLLREQLAHSIILGENNYFTTGSGSGQPTGVVTAANSGGAAVTAASSSAITADEVLELYWALDPLYQPFASFMCSPEIAEALSKLKDSNGQYIWGNFTDGTPGTIKGRPVILNSNMAGFGVNNVALIFFVPRYYWIYEFGGNAPRIKVLDQTSALSGKIDILGYVREDANLVNPNAAVTLQLAAM